MGNCIESEKPTNDKSNQVVTPELVNNYKPDSANDMSDQAFTPGLVNDHKSDLAEDTNDQAITPELDEIVIVRIESPGMDNIKSDANFYMVDDIADSANGLYAFHLSTDNEKMKPPEFTVWVPTSEFVKTYYTVSAVKRLKILPPRKYFYPELRIYGTSQTLKEKLACIMKVAEDEDESVRVSQETMPSQSENEYCNTNEFFNDALMNTVLSNDDPSYKRVCRSF